MPKGLPNKVREHLQKARDSSLLAVEIYNKPAVSFKSGGFISLMIIAWTAVLHAYFFRKKIKPFAKRGRRYEKIVEKIGDREISDYKYWDLSKCLQEYFSNDTQNPIRKNLDFFIPLRNMIEHRSIPELDPNIFGECQQLLLNLDEFIEQNFGIKYCIRESLSFALQLFPNSKGLEDAVKSNKKNKPIVEFITRYRESLSREVFENSKYSFKAFLIKVANHESKDTLPIRFINWDVLSEDEKKKIKDLGTVLIKEKQVQVAVINLGRFKVQQVIDEINKKLNNREIRYHTENGNEYKRQFNSTLHTFCWKKYKIRPQTGDVNPARTKPQYCSYDDLHGDYVYTQAWVEFLITQITGDDYYLNFQL